MTTRRQALESAMQDTTELLSQKLDELLPAPEGMPEDRLFEAMRYATLSQGKRIRPFLTVKTSELLGVSIGSSIQTAAAIEMIHAYSLVHDDLPALDNDDWRRGAPSCHRKFDEATAILAGDALLTYAFEVIANSRTHVDCAVRLELISAIARTAGFAGMVGGQIIDLNPLHDQPDFAEVVRLQRMKTGALFAMSCEAGAILGKAPQNIRMSLRAYANSIGLAFQIIDDLLDTNGGQENGGKGPRLHAVEQKATLVECLGKDKAQEHAKFLANQAIEHLSAFDKRADLLRELALFILERES